jgi:HSP20 family protein
VYISVVAFARWDPIRDLLAIQQRLDRYAPGPAGWKPAVDICETPDQYIVTVEVPGMSRTDLDIHVHGGEVVISGVRRERTPQYEQYHRIERGHGSFSRTFHLPVAVDGDRVTADLRDGVLTVTCPKAADGATRRIQVS